MKSKKMYLAGISLLILALVTGCNRGKDASSKDAVQEAEDLQQDSNSLEADSTETENPESNETEDDTINSQDDVIWLEEDSEDETDENNGTSTDGVDVDLTTMNSNMVYAEVFQMMMDPDEYIGKTVRMRGQYYSTYYEETDKRYYYVIISDATECCSQGMEFVWDEDSHTYPDEYPEEETEIEITGVFETYQEEGDDNLYCHLLTDDIAEVE